VSELGSEPNKKLCRATPPSRFASRSASHQKTDLNGRIEKENGTITTSS